MSVCAVQCRAVIEGSQTLALPKLQVSHSPETFWLLKPAFRQQRAGIFIMQKPDVSLFFAIAADFCGTW